DWNGNNHPGPLDCPTWGTHPCPAPSACGPHYSRPHRKKNLSQVRLPEDQHPVIIRDARCQSTGAGTPAIPARWMVRRTAAQYAFNALANLVLRPRSPAAPGRLWRSPLSPFFAPLLSRPPLPTPLLLLLRSPRIP